MDDFKEIWIPFAERFYRVAFHLLEDEADAEDAVQELYLKLWTSRDSLSDIRTPLAYGITLLKNICIDKVRRRGLRQAEPLDAGQAERTHLSEAPPDRRAVLRDMLKRLLEEMEKLPGKQAEVLKMRALEGLEYKEISQRTGLSGVHVRVLVSMARKTLKNALDYEDDKGN